MSDLRTGMHGGDAALQVQRASVALVTTHEDLVERVGMVLSHARVELTVASHIQAVRAVARSTSYAAIVLDLRDNELLPQELWDALSFAGRSPEDLMLIGCSGFDDPHLTSRLTVSTYPRDSLEWLLAELARAVPGGVEDTDPAAAILGDHPSILLVREQIRNLARFPDISVLILGETGTGKELVASSIHETTCGAQHPRVAINCASIPENLFESELFGHEAGAYTGARGVRIGLLEAAAGGTVFLDEIGEMPASLQPKLLRALETREFRRVGSNRNIRLQSRVVSATNRDAWLDREPTLRPDLLYRLAGFTIRLPALRERLQDLPLLVRHFLSSFGERHQLAYVDVHGEALELLARHHWPGNVRELRSVIEHAAIVSPDGYVRAEHVRAALEHYSAREGSVRAPTPVPQPDETSGVPERNRDLRMVEQRMIRDALRDSKWNVSRAARTLGIPRSTLRSKIRRLGLRPS